MASQTTARAKEYVERRRSPRVINKVAFVISGESTERQLFHEQVFTLSINAHGALIALTTQVTVGQKLLLMNPKTWNRTEGRVIRLDMVQGEWTQAAIQFAQPAAELWSTGAPPMKSPPHTKKNRSP